MAKLRTSGKNKAATPEAREQEVRGQVEWEAGAWESEWQTKRGRDLDPEIHRPCKSPEGSDDLSPEL